LNWEKEPKIKFLELFCVRLTEMKLKLLFLALLPLGLFAQTGGTHAFALLDLTYNARAAGLANDFISVKDDDINLGVANPSLYNSTMNNFLSFNQALLSGGINYGQVAYGRNLSKGFLAGSIRYVNYGNFTMTDATGQNIGNFRPFECIIGAGYGVQLNPRISVGGNFNLLYSQLEIYNAFGMSIDLAGTYTSKDEKLLVTALVKNAGIQLKNYVGKTKAPLPAEFQMAASYKLEHAPFRFSLLAHHLNTWDITYRDPNLTPTLDVLTGDTIPVKYAGFGEKLARHFSYQAEILASKTVQLRFGFDYHRRQEMKLEDRPGLSGFTFGLGLRFKKIRLDYGFSIFSRAGFNNMLTLSSYLSTWKK
jgi:hypothetical protein